MVWFFGRAARKGAREGMAAAETKAAGPQGFVSLSGQGPATWTPRSYQALAREGYTKNPVAYRCVRLIAEAAAAVPFTVFEDGREMSDHAVAGVLATPNGQACGPDFMEAIYGHLLLAGNAFVGAHMAGPVLRGLHLLRPDRISVARDAEGWPEAYEYREGRSLRRYPATAGNGPRLLHLRLFHRLDDDMGFAPLAAATMALDLHNASTTWNKALLDNSARPSGALVYQPKDGGNLTEEQYARLKDELEEGYAGARRAGRPLLLEGGLDWKSMGLTPREMDFVEARNGASRDIALAFGVPPMLLGIPGDNTYANYAEANRAFYRLTVLPLLARTAAALGAWLAETTGLPIRLDFDPDMIPGLATERDQLWARVAAADFLSDDEKREAVGYQTVGERP